MQQMRFMLIAIVAAMRYETHLNYSLGHKQAWIGNNDL